MAKSLNDTKGQAQSRSTYTYTDGEQTLRFVGDILPRYVYWIENKMPFEALQFDREDEKWINGEDPVREAYPDAKAGFAYLTKAFTSDGKLVVVNLKKKMFEQILSLAKEEGNPFDIDNGYAITFEKKKTGPLAFNVDYVLNVVKILKTPKGPITAEQRTLYENSESLDDMYKLPTASEQRESIRKYKAKGEDLPDNVQSEFDNK